MQILKGEIPEANLFINNNLERIIDWSIGDIKRCCRMGKDGSCDDNGALVGAFILWCCAIEFFGGLYTGYAGINQTKPRYREFIQKYMPKYDWEKVEELRWSLTHYYSPHNFVLYHEEDNKSNELRHLSLRDGRILLHLGLAVKDLEEAVENYRQELSRDNNLKVKLYKFHREQPPIMPLKASFLHPTNSLSSLATLSGTVSLSDWKKTL